MEVRGIEYYCMDCDERYIEHFIDEPVIWHCKKCNREGVLIESRWLLLKRWRGYAPLTLGYPPVWRV